MDTQACGELEDIEERYISLPALDLANIAAVEISPQPVFSASRQRLLFTGDFARSANRVDYDVSPDGESFVMLNSGEEDRAATQISLLLNWHEELKRLVPTN